MFRKFILGLNVFLSIFSSGIPKTNQPLIKEAAPISYESNRSYLLNKNFVRSEDLSQDEETRNLNIEYSYPTTDLKWIFSKGSDNWRTYNLESLKPKNGEDTSFKFLVGKPVNDNFYLYIYTNDNLNYDFSSLYAEVSTSVTLNGEEIVEQYTQKQARFINSVGYYTRFSKWSLDGIVSSDSINRIKFKNIKLSTRKGIYSYIFDKKVEDEIFWNSQDDFTYQYWSDEIISVKDAHIVANLEGKDNVDWWHQSTHNPTDYKSYNEFFYYFFDLDKDMSSYGDLEKIDYTCQYFTHTGWNNAEMVLMETAGAYNTGDNISCYHNNLTNKEDLKRGYDGSFGLIDTSSQFLNLSVEYGINTYSTNYYYFWLFNIIHTNSYQRPNILESKYIDQYEMNSNDRQFFKNNFENWEDDKGNVVKTKYAFDIGDGIRAELGNESMVRRTIESRVDGQWYHYLFGFREVYGKSLIHWVSQVQIFRLTFKNDISDCIAFDVYDVPRDVNAVIVNVVDRPTLSDDIVKSVVSLWNSLWNSFKNIAPLLIPLAITILAIILLIVFYPSISAFAQATSQVIRTKGDIKSNRLKENEKKRVESKSKKKKVNKNKDG